MKKRNILMAGISVFCSFFSAMAEVSISEVMPCNLTTQINDEYNYSGWMEFHNSGKSSVNLKNATLTQYKKKGKVKWSWVVDYDFSVPAGGYALIYFDKGSTKGHAPYKIDADGGSLELTLADGTVSTIPYPQQIPHKSYGFSDGIYGYMEPTPKVANSTAYPDLSYACDAPLFGGVTPGVYEEASGKITLTCATEGASIYYTKDGSEPTPTTGILYEAPIEFNKTRVLRAKAFKEGMLSSVIATASYILYGEEHTRCTDGKRTPVISVVADDRFFHSDEIGIYVKGSNGTEGTKSCVAERANYNRDWTRAVNVEWFDGGVQKMSQEAEVAVMGGCSREHKVKSLKISTSKKVGALNFEKNVFDDQEDKTTNLYASYQLRNGGNAYSEGSVRMRDGFMQSIAKGMKNIDYQAYQPVAYYLNGEYQGLMGMRERTNKEYVYSNYGLDEDDIDVVEMSSESYAATTGDLLAYERMIDYAKSNYEKDDFLPGIASFMDIEEYLNYMIFEQFIVNTDWPSNNSKLWRKRKGGKFRWILYDTDFGLGLFESYAPNYCDVNNNMMEWCMGIGDKVSWGNGNGESYSFTDGTKWKTILFGSLMKNKNFQQMYLTQSLVHLSTSFAHERVKSVWDSIYTLVKNEYCAMYQYGDLQKEAEPLLSFAKKRVDVIYEQLAKYYGLGTELVTLKGTSSKKSASFFVNGIAMENGFSLQCLSGMKVTLAANLPDGYKVSQWKVGTKNYDTPTVELTMDAKTTVELVVEEDTAIPTVLINELCAKNTKMIDPVSGEASDWIELYNGGTEPVDVAGLYLSDNVDDPMLHQIAKGYSNTIIPAKGHLLLWADDYAESGPLHLGFKLSDLSGETIILSKMTNAGLVTIDQVSFATLGEDVSYGRESDGAKSFKLFTECLDGTPESTPGAENGTVDCDSILKVNMVHLAISSNDIKASFLVNGEPVANPSDYLAWKHNELSINPVIPSDATFKYWESSLAFQFSEDLLKSTDKWNYHYADTTPSGAWYDKKYDVTGWASGSGRFGYATDTRKYDTELDYGGDAKNKYLTSYFRKSFTVPSDKVFDSLKVTLTYDDGAVLYLNGKELKRWNLPSKEVITYETATIDYLDDRVSTLMIPKSQLATGTNVFAVEVHQYNASSSDMTFAMTAEIVGHTNKVYEQTLTIVPAEDMTLTLALDCPERTDVPDVTETSMLTIVPNPVEETTVVTAKTGEITALSLYNMKGGVVMRVFPAQASDSYELNVEMLKEGNYLMQVETTNGRFEGKLLKK